MGRVSPKNRKSTKNWESPEKDARKMRREAHDAVEEFFDDLIRAERWFETENPGLGGMTPDEVIRLGRADKVMNFIEDAREANGQQKIRH